MGLARAGVDGYGEDPPAWDGKKVSLLDTDHIWGVGGNAAWVWKSFLRGHNPIFMDPYDGTVLGKPADRAGNRSAARWVRRAASPNGSTSRPDARARLASTGYCLANPGTEYLIYQPKVGEDFSVENEGRHVSIRMVRSRDNWGGGCRLRGSRLARHGNSKRRLKGSRFFISRHSEAVRPQSKCP